VSTIQESRIIPMKRIASAGALGLLAAMSVGQAHAQMDSLGNTGLGDARAQNLPTSSGINNNYGGYGYGYAGAPGYGAASPVYRGRSAYMPRHRHRFHARHW
jgi:hypothetical protein